MPHRWCAAANLRRSQIESGIDITFNDVFKPLFVERICELIPKRIIEVGAGTGHLSKALAGHGFHITAIEPSPGMYTIARDVLANEEVLVRNCSSFDLPKESVYDLAFSHLVVHVIEDLSAFLKSVYILLCKNAHLLFSIPHPCFYNAYKSVLGEEYNYMAPMLKEISFNITKDPANKITGVPYHHRPLSNYINCLVDCGFSIERFDEIYPREEIQEKYGQLWDYPRYCLFQCRKL